MLAPIVLFVYNRPWHTRQTLEALEKNILADQSILYIYADGPKIDTSEENLAMIAETRAIIREKNWCKEVYLIESDINKGLADSIVGGVTEIVNKYRKIIVLEDDIVTSTGFLQYMNDALNFFETEDRVMHISGYMFPGDGNINLPEVFFLNVPTCWGWATWKRAWDCLITDAPLLLERLEKENKWKMFNTFGEKHLENQLRGNVDGTLKTWFIKWHASIFLRKGFCLHPKVSTVQNIGFDATGVHCGKTNNFHIPKLMEKITVSGASFKESKTALNIVQTFYASLNKPVLQKKISWKRRLLKKLKYLLKYNIAGL